MKTPPLPSRSPRRIIILALSGAVLLILAGSLIALDQIGIGPAVFASYVSETVSRLAGANLVVKVDRTVLPADGKTTTTIHATNTNQTLPITARLITGSGSLNPDSNQPGNATFTYTTPAQPGIVEIEVSSGSLTETIILTLKEALSPTTPVLVAPADKSTSTNPKLEVSGTGPANTKILLTDNGTLNTTTKTDANGNFRVLLEKPLYAGQHTLAAIAQTDLGVNSTVSNLTTVTIVTEPVKLDSSHIRLSPSRPVAGDSFGLFIPVSLNTARVTAEFQGRTFELTDLHQTSVFTGTLPAPEQAGAYSINLTLFDLANTATKFDQAVNVLVVSQ